MSARIIPELRDRILEEVARQGMTNVSDFLEKAVVWYLNKIKLG